ncbi:MULTISPECIES: hypothetical protein [Nonomuraea]|uniref:Uncharacterized protein n=1 Tax=Nonomuraea ferruginea TaxID=46174 RepID=A0ABT4T4H3_9ACTN|nr:hypothetical protein [Nonomuraea ferruginea]MDA0644392.1 hypothetical protein [Nonomuraea ferruginea]
MGSRTAISAGILAVSMVTLPVVAAAPAGAQVLDCEHGGGGLLSGLTDGLCDTVGAVTGTVDKLTGGLTEPLTEGLGKTTDKVLGTVGEAVPTAAPRSSAEPSADAKPSAKPKKTLLPEPLSDVCLPGLACEGEGLLEETLRPTPETTGRTTAEPEPEREREERRRDPDDRDREDDREEADAAPTTWPTQPPARETHSVDGSEEPVTDDPAADPEDLRIDLLWPDPFTDKLPLQVGREPVVRPVAKASDVVGTTLTVVLLATAVLASRVVQQRRRRSEQHESIPFEPAGRHRLA